MTAEELIEVLSKDFYTGVPDSQLKELCNYLMENEGISKKHIIAANEGNCVGIAAGHYLATGKIPVVYMQNSGVGNAINPIVSLLHPEVYGIPCIFIIGWRGEPDISDEPQHIFQGKITQVLLDDLGIDSFVIGKGTNKNDIQAVIRKFDMELKSGKSVAFIVRKSVFTDKRELVYQNRNSLVREQVIDKIADIAGEDVIISTTGKVSRELFEIRERKHQDHRHDFLTVGSMGHSSSIALGIALEQPGRRIWCIDGDGAALMHMGAMAVIGANAPHNLIHVIINNEAHESVGGMPTVGGDIDWIKIAQGCGYPKLIRISNEEELEKGLQEAKRAGELVFAEIKCSIGSRIDLGRPTTTPEENKKRFMEFLGTGQE